MMQYILLRAGVVRGLSLATGSCCSNRVRLREKPARAADAAAAAAASAYQLKCGEQRQWPKAAAGMRVFFCKLRCDVSAVLLRITFCSLYKSDHMTATLLRTGAAVRNVSVRKGSV
jgi:putative hemolysin